MSLKLFIMERVGSCEQPFLIGGLSSIVSFSNKMWYTIRMRKQEHCIIGAGCRSTAVAVVLAAGIAAAAFRCPAGDVETDAEAIARLGGVAKDISDMLANCHVSRRAPDDTISRRAWTNVLESCDSSRSILLPEDVRELERHIDSLDDDFKAGDFSFPLKVRDIYVKRLAERHRFATNMLAHVTSAMLAKGGSIRIDRAGEPWMEAGAQRDEWWSKMLMAMVAKQLAETASRDGSASNKVAAAAAEVAKRQTKAMEMVRKKPVSTVCSEFLSAVVSSYDAHTMYLPPDKFKRFNTEMSLSMCGIGAGWDFKDGVVTIMRVLPGSPLAKCGEVKVGDQILAVSPKADGEMRKLSGLSRSEVSALLSGKKGEKITLEVRHAADGSVKRHDIVRDEIKMDDESAFSRVVEAESGGRRRKMGYLRLPVFYSARAVKGGSSRSSGGDVGEELRKLRDAGVEGVLFDLRGNSGGGLEEAVKVIGGFVHDGPAVSMRTVNSDVSLSVTDGGAVCEVPVVVMIDKSSGSAGELVPGTLQDLGRAIIVGDERTFGKGTGQTVLKLDSENGQRDGALVVTVGRFYRVTGASTQFKGVESDILLDSLSLPDRLKGERGLKYPLPWDTVEAVPHKKSWDLDKFIPKLREASARRLAASKEWKTHMENVNWQKKTAADNIHPVSFPDAKARREKQARIAAEMNRMNRARSRAAAKEPWKKGVDPVRDEALNILADLVELNGGRRLPAAAPSADSSTLFDSLDDE